MLLDADRKPSRYWIRAESTSVSIGTASRGSLYEGQGVSHSCQPVERASVRRGAWRGSGVSGRIHGSVSSLGSGFPVHRSDWIIYEVRPQHHCLVAEQLGLSVFLSTPSSFHLLLSFLFCPTIFSRQRHWTGPILVHRDDKGTRKTHRHGGRNCSTLSSYQERPFPSHGFNCVTRATQCSFR